MKNNKDKSKIEKQIGEIEGRARVLSDFQLKFVACIAFSWSLFQLWYASPLPFLFGFGRSFKSTSHGPCHVA